METYLVTGGAGFIGANFINFLLEKYNDVKIINFDCLTYASNLKNLAKYKFDNRYIFEYGDISKSNEVKNIFNKYSIDYVVHFAAESHVDRSIIDPSIFVSTNVLGTCNLLEEAKSQWYSNETWKDNKKFIQVSTDEVYGSLGNNGYFTEKTPINPHSPYSASKASADLIVKSYWDTFRMPVNITRCSNNYGPFQHKEKLIPMVIDRCVQSKDIPVYGDGLNIRDWLYVEDHCSAIDTVIHRGYLGEVYNIGGENELTNLALIENIINILSQKMGKKVNKSLITFVEDRKGHDRRYGIDPSKIQNDLGWYPKRDFKEGLEKTINWYLMNT